jgi:hypothetical protein
MSRGILASLDGAAGLNTEFIPGATSLGEYVCPSETSVSLKTVGIVVGRPFYTATVQPTNADTGTVFVKIGGTTRMEFRVCGQTVPFVSGFDEKEYWQQQSQKFSFDGMVIPASTAVRLETTPTNPDMNIVWRTTVLFKKVSDGEVNFQTNFTTTATNTANQVIFDYTPANDSYLVQFHVEGYIVSQWSGQGYMCFGGRSVLDLGRIGQNKECTSPCIDSSGMGTYGSGGYWINTWGLKMYPGDVICAMFHTVAPDKSEFQGMVFGQSTALGGSSPTMKVYVSG